MMKRRLLLITLLTVLLVVGIPTCLLVREFRQEQLNHTLIAAVKARDAAKALAALKAGANANARDNGDKPPAFRDSLNHLVSHLFHRNTRPPSGPTALALMYHLTFPETIEPLKRRGYETFTLPENTVLLAALLQHGADPNARDAHNATPLMNAAEWGYTESMRLLLQHGAEVNAKGGDNGRTALHYALNDPVAIRLLISQGADVDARTKEGQTPLMDAFCKPEGVQALLEAHADVNLRDWSGYTALDYNQSEYENLRQKKFPYNQLFTQQRQYEKALDQFRKVENLLHKAGAKTGRYLSSSPSH